MNDVKLIDLWEFIREKEYHEDENIIFINSTEFNEFCGLFKEFDEGYLELYFKGNYFVVNLEEMIDAINSDFTDKLIDRKKIKE